MEVSDLFGLDRWCLVGVTSDDSDSSSLVSTRVLFLRVLEALTGESRDSSSGMFGGSVRSSSDSSGRGTFSGLVSVSLGMIVQAVVGAS